MKQLAIIGPTASGKSDLALKVAQKMNANIFSIDSLSIYKEIDIVSAKPSKEELSKVKHFGVNVLSPDAYFSVDILRDLYKSTLKECQKSGKNLVIVGGTSFYLKSLIDGLSVIPILTPDIQKRVQNRLKNLEQTYKDLSEIDAEYMQKIAPNDSYRIEKVLLIYEASQMSPTEWFLANPPQKIIEDLPIYNIEVSRDVLRERIRTRTYKMYDKGLVDEVSYLEQKYTRLPHAMGAIGIVEVLEYLDAKVTQEQMLENIITHTAQLAKRQQTFNKTQFRGLLSAPLEDLEGML